MLYTLMLWKYPGCKACFKTKPAGKPDAKAKLVCTYYLMQVASYYALWIVIMRINCNYAETVSCGNTLTCYKSRWYFFTLMLLFPVIGRLMDGARLLWTSVLVYSTKMRLTKHLLHHPTTGCWKMRSIRPSVHWFRRTWVYSTTSPSVPPVWKQFRKMQLILVFMASLYQNQLCTV